MTALSNIGGPFHRPSMGRKQQISLQTVERRTIRMLQGYRTQEMFTVLNGGFGSVDRSGGIMDRGLLDISEFFLRRQYNYVCEAHGLRNPSAPSRSIPGELPEQDCWKDRHLSARKLSRERQHTTVSAADASTVPSESLRPEAGPGSSVKPAVAVFSSFHRALTDLRSKEALFIRASCKVTLLPGPDKPCLLQ